MSNKDDYYGRKSQFPREKPVVNPHSPSPHHEWDKQKPIASKPIDFSDFFPRVDRWGINILGQLDILRSIAEAKPSYPPYNITRDTSFADQWDTLENRWEIAIAVAGFRKNELEVYVEDSVLHVRTDPKTNFEVEDIREVIHQGIAQRNWALRFALGKYIEVTKVKLKDGLLTISLEKQIPEEKKPKIIDIE